MLQRVRGTNDVQAELNVLIKASSISKAIKYPFKNILQRKYRPQLVMAIAIPFFQQLTEINITFYAPILFRTIGFGESASLLSSLMIIGVLGTISNFISMLIIVDKLGPRALFMIWRYSDVPLTNYNWWTYGSSA